MGLSPSLSRNIYLVFVFFLSREVFLKKIEIELTYNIILVSDIQHESTFVYIVISLSITPHSYKLFSLWWDLLRSIFLATFRYTYRIINYCHMLYITFQALRAFLKPKYNLAHPPSTSNMDLLLLTLDSPPPHVSTRALLLILSIQHYQLVSLILKDKTK